MPITALATLLALTTLLVVGAALCRHVAGVRATRRELDRYLRWLLDETAGPVSVAQPRRWPTAPAGRRRKGRMSPAGAGRAR